MKYLSLTLIFTVSCSFYSPNFMLEVDGLSKGILVVSDSIESTEYEIDDDNSIYLTLEKGILYSITLYPDFYGKPSHFPCGGIVATPQNFLTLSPHLGLLSSVVNDLHEYNYTVTYELLGHLSEKFLDESDVWRYHRFDCIDYLLGNIELNMIKPEEGISIPDLNYLFNFVSDNKLLREWYPGLFVFYNSDKNERLTVEIYDNGEFCTLISR